MKSQKSVFIVFMLLSFILSSSKIVSASQTSNILALGINIQVDDSLVLRNIENDKSISFYEWQKMKLEMENGPSIKGRLISANKDSIILSDGTFNFVVDTKDVSKIIIPRSIGRRVVGVVIKGVGVYIIVVSGIGVIYGAIGGLVESTLLWAVPIGLVGGVVGYGATIWGSKIRNKRFDLKKNWEVQ